MESDEAFSEFSEPEIKFPPTYKFNIGTDEYDMNWMGSYSVSQKTKSNQYRIRHGFVRSLIEKPRASRGIRMRSALVAPTSLTVEDSSPQMSTADGVADAASADSSETFSNYTEKTIKFVLNNQKWYIGDSEYRMECILSQDVEIHPNDWIGIYDASFHNLDDYIAYEYMAKVHRPDIQPVHVAPGTRVVILSFPVGSGVRIPGFYRFIYFSQPNSDVRSVLGVSSPFEASFKSDESEPWAQATTAPTTPKPSSAATDVFTDFTGLDVANLSRHFSHDLSID
ncbi:hypothetical protein MSG28_010131 [Choristoneura fumiferana]|uniref:Uncharacterized protein n=1 Tax=Choristoneura fumiferana TaxID=7141 RepID=A0ACC0KJC1_CHOFU|nr:hypothetical protein MSG28_010131 [Choristoneura fumiferana]